MKLEIEKVRINYTILESAWFLVRRSYCLNKQIRNYYTTRCFVVRKKAKLI